MRDLPEPPSFAITRIRRKQKRWKELLIERQKLYGKVLTSAVAEQLCDAILFRVDIDEGIDEGMEEDAESAITEYLREWIGERLGTAELEKMSLELTEAQSSFARGRYKRWDGTTPIWSLVYVADMERRLSRRSTCYAVCLKALGGPNAGAVWETIVFGGQAQSLMREAGGLPKYKYKYRDSMLGGLYLVVWLEPQKNGMEMRIGYASSSVQNANKKLLAARQQKCSHGFHEDTCLNCTFGMDKCPYARHAQTYTEIIRCTNFRVKDGKRYYHKGYKICRDQGVCHACLISGSLRSELFKKRRKEDVR